MGACVHLSFQLWNAIWWRVCACCPGFFESLCAWVLLCSEALVSSVSFTVALTLFRTPLLRGLLFFSDSSSSVSWRERFDGDILCRAECSKICTSSGCGSQYLFSSAAGLSFTDDGWARHWKIINKLKHLKKKDEHSRMSYEVIFIAMYFIRTEVSCSWLHDVWVWNLHQGMGFKSNQIWLGDFHSFVPLLHKHILQRGRQSRLNELLAELMFMFSFGSTQSTWSTTKTSQQGWNLSAGTRSSFPCCVDVACSNRVMISACREQPAALATARVVWRLTFFEQPLN